jgi:ABC-type transporter MlaC component
MKRFGLVSASARTGMVVLPTVFFIVIGLFTLTWVEGAWAGPPTDQLRSGVERVIKILRDPELKGDAKANERTAAVNKVADEIFDFGETAKRALGQHWAQRTARPNAKSSFASSPRSSSARTSPRWTSTTPR